MWHSGPSLAEQQKKKTASNPSTSMPCVPKTGEQLLDVRCRHYKNAKLESPGPDEPKLSRGRSEPVFPGKMRKGTLGMLE